MKKFTTYYIHSCTVIPWYSQRIESRIPLDTQTHRFSSPIYKKVKYFHVTYAYLPVYFNALLDYL
jgi:hypothetical protein